MAKMSAFLFLLMFFVSTFYVQAESVHPDLSCDTGISHHGGNSGPHGPHGGCGR